MSLRHLSRYPLTVFTSIRLRYSRLLLIATPLKTLSEKMSSEERSHKINITNGLLLYHNNYSFYSQKVSYINKKKNRKQLSDSSYNNLYRRRKLSTHVI